MTKQTTDEGNAPLDQDTDTTVTTTETADFVEDFDPMIEEMKAAEAEIAAAAEGSPNGAAAAPAGDAADPEKAAGKDKSATLMIPKARLDEVLSERDLLRDQVGYLRGLNDARQGQPAAVTPPTATSPKPDMQTPQATTDQSQGNAAVDTIEQQIEAAEKKKLELAERYDEGEISSKQWKEQEIAIDKEIRQLSNQRFERVREESRVEAQAVVSAKQKEEVVNSTALDLQKAHPNVAVIDALPPGVRDGVWKDITAQATQNLALRGIDVKDGSAASHVALVREKARLTDNLEAFGIAGVKPAAAPAATPAVNTQAQKKPSDMAINRAAKIDLANSQPPSTADMGKGANNAELTESDIENMTEDQMADLLATAPHLVKRIMGGTAN